MSKLTRTLFVLALVPCAAACSSTGTSSAAGATAQAASRTTVTGTFAQYLVSPSGDVDGTVLDDGTVARFAPHALAADASALRPGDMVRVEGNASNGGRVLHDASVARGNDVIVAAGPPRPGPPGPRGPRGPREADLTAVSATGTVRAFSTDPRGAIDGIVLSDGTTARAGRKARLESLGLKAGDTVTVTGRGGSYPQGKALHIETITLPSGEVRTVERPRAELAPTAAEGTIARVLVNPHGDVDGLLLEGGGLIRLRPTPRSTQLVVGAKVRGEGEGTATFVRAEKLTLTASGAVIDLAMPPAPPTAPPPTLAQLDDTSSVAQLLTTPDGDLDAVILADGAIVKLPPALRDEAGSAIAVGTKLVVHGEGGTYGGTKSLRADRVQLGSGQVFTEPSPASPPPPPAVAP